MDVSDLHDTYAQLRRELDVAYSAPVWDSQQIDRIADRLSPIETALASAHGHPLETGCSGG